MIALALVILGLSLADWIACGLGGEPQGIRRVIGGLVIAVAVVIAIAAALDLPFPLTAIILGLVVVGSSWWLGAKGFGLSAQPWARPRLALASQSGRDPRRRPHGIDRPRNLGSCPR